MEADRTEICDLAAAHPERVRARRWSAPIDDSFLTGSNDQRFPDDGEGPVRHVRLSDFAIACHAVSNL
jgi:sulfatase modifying factor 1